MTTDSQVQNPLPLPTLERGALPEITATQMNQIIMQATGKYGLDSRVLVEHTGRNLVELAERFAPDGPVLVVAGRGGNGSGGLAAARMLGSRGRRVWVVPTHEPENYSGAPREQLELLRHYSNVRIKSSMPKMKYACVIDAAIGTALEGPPRGRTLDVITVLNNLHDGCTVISLDVPTGMISDDGSIPGEVVQASMTLAVALPKQGVGVGGSAGRVFVGDIGLPPDMFDGLGLPEVRLPAFVTELVEG